MSRIKLGSRIPTEAWCFGRKNIAKYIILCILHLVNAAYKKTDDHTAFLKTGGMVKYME